MGRRERRPMSIYREWIAEPALCSDSPPMTAERLLRAFLFAAAFALAAGHAHAQTLAQPLLTYGVTGSVSGEGLDNPANLLAREDVQRVVVHAAHGGVSAPDANAALNGVDVDQLVRGGLLRSAGDRYVIAFNLITADARAPIDAALQPYMQSLASAFLARRAHFERLMSGY